MYLPPLTCTWIVTSEISDSGSLVWSPVESSVPLPSVSTSSGVVDGVGTLFEAMMEGAVPSDFFSKLVDALDRAIPPDGWQELEARIQKAGWDLMGARNRYRENGGFYRGGHTPQARVASWNNTRKDKQEVIEWFEQAILLL